MPLLSLMPALDEAEVRHLCGQASYARATALQVAGHVARPRKNELMLSAEVRGTWRRIDHVQVEADRNRLMAACSCGTPGMCSHAGALLLQWLRAPDSFESLPETPSTESTDVSGALGAQPDAPRTELLQALQIHVLEDLRQIARARNVRLTARSKVDVVAQLAEGLVEPANIDDTLAELRPEELLALRVSCLVADGTATFTALQAGFEGSGGSGEVPIERLLGLGLVVGNSPDRYSSYSFKVPRVVAARLPVWSELIRRADAAPPEPPVAAVTGLDMLELLAILSHGLRDGLSGRPPAAGDATRAVPHPPGWDIDAAEAHEIQRGALEYRGREVTLVPAPLLGDEDLVQLAAQTGHSPAAIDFGMHLLMALGLVKRGRRLLLQEDRWQAFNAATADDRHAALCREWLQMTGWSELALVAGIGGPFQLRGRLTDSAGRVPFLVSHLAALRRLGARCVGLLAPNTWYDVASLIATINRLAPSTLPERSTEYWSRETLDKLAWWLIDRHGRKHLALGQPADRSRVFGALLAALVEGPLAWLGLVDVTADRDGPRAFRVRPGAGVLVGRPSVESPSPAAVIVGEDGSVLVPAGTADAAVHSLLTRVGEFVDGSAAGLRYRLTAERVQTAFDEGLSGPELLGFLEERARAPLPGHVRSMLERWWAGYASVRLYDELSFVELSEDVLPAEVLAAVSALRQHLVYALSPRLLAVEATAVDAVVAELVRQGYAPRLEAGGVGT